jgi:hypothetical protein
LRPKSQPNAEPEGFLELWQLWRPHARKTDGRGKARETYRKWLLNGADPQRIFAGARHHLATMSDKDRAYIPLLSSYLNSERWEDEADAEAMAAQKQAQAEADRIERENGILERMPNSKMANDIRERREMQARMMNRTG